MSAWFAQVEKAEAHLDGVQSEGKRRLEELETDATAWLREAKQGLVRSLKEGNVVVLPSMRKKQKVMPEEKAERKALQELNGATTRPPTERRKEAGIEEEQRSVAELAPEKLKVRELRAELKHRGWPIGGRKAELIARLAEALREEATAKDGDALGGGNDAAEDILQEGATSDAEDFMEVEGASVGDEARSQDSSEGSDVFLDVADAPPDASEASEDGNGAKGLAGAAEEASPARKDVSEAAAAAAAEGVGSAEDPMSEDDIELVHVEPAPVNPPGPAQLPNASVDASAGALAATTISSDDDASVEILDGPSPTATSSRTVPSQPVVVPKPLPVQAVTCTSPKPRRGFPNADEPIVMAPLEPGPSRSRSSDTNSPPASLATPSDPAAASDPAMPKKPRKFLSGIKSLAGRVLGSAARTNPKDTSSKSKAAPIPALVRAESARRAQEAREAERQQRKERMARIREKRTEARVAATTSAARPVVDAQPPASRKRGPHATVPSTEPATSHQSPPPSRPPPRRPTAAPSPSSDTSSSGYLSPSNNASASSDASSPPANQKPAARSPAGPFASLLHGTQAASPFAGGAASGPSLLLSMSASLNRRNVPADQRSPSTESLRPELGMANANDSSGRMRKRVIEESHSQPPSEPRPRTRPESAKPPRPQHMRGAPGALEARKGIPAAPMAPPPGPKAVAPARKVLAHRSPVAVIREKMAAAKARARAEELAKAEQANEPSYAMSDRGDSSSDEDSDEEEARRRHKKIPSWARGPSLKALLVEQHAGEAPLDAERIFPPAETCDLLTIFQGDKPRYSRRTSSANWTMDGEQGLRRASFASP